MGPENGGQALVDLDSLTATLLPEWGLRALMLAAFGLGLGILWADVWWSLRPFARRRVSALGAGTSFIGGLCGSLFLATLGDTLIQPTTIALGLGGTAGAMVLTWGIREGETGLGPADSSNLLTDTEISRPKQRAGDIWGVVTGASGAGKTSLIESMSRAAVLGDPALRGWRASGLPRVGDDQRIVVTQFEVASGAGVRRLRLIETHRSDELPGSQSREDVDAIVMVIDPTQVESLASSFPTISGGTTVQIDPNRALLALKPIWVNQGSGRPVVWVAISKPDLLRFSIDRALVRFPIAIGPAWHRQMSRMSPQDRQRLSEPLNMSVVTVPDELPWGGGSPWLVHCNPEDHSSEFGGAQLLGNIITTLT